jgi:hypothetical protein
MFGLPDSLPGRALPLVSFRRGSMPVRQGVPPTPTFVPSSTSSLSLRHEPPLTPSVSSIHVSTFTLPSAVS